MEVDNGEYLNELFSVYQFMPNGFYERIVNLGNIEAAIRAFRLTIQSGGAKTGRIQRVIITDGGDSICLEWIHNKGIVFPPELFGRE